MNIKALVVENLSFGFIIGTVNIKSLQLLKVNNQFEVVLNGSKLETISNSVSGSSINNVTIYPKTSQLICLKSSETIPADATVVASLKNCPPRDVRNLTYSFSITNGKNPNILVHNDSPFPIFVPKNIPIFTLNTEPESEVINQLVEVSHEQDLKDHKNFLVERNFKFGEFVDPKVNFGDLTSSEFKTLSALIKKHHLSFSKDKYDVGLVRNYRYKMETKPNHKVWAENQRRLAPSVLERVQAQFELEVKHGLLVKKASKYSHPLVVVKKPSGDLRVCADLRKANFEIETDKWPIPDIHQMFLNLGPHMNRGKKVYMASMDILMAYRSLRVHEEDIEKLGFCFGSDQYCHTRMAFGAKDAPSTFSLLMRVILNGLDYVVNYLDDLIVICPDFQIFCDTLEKLFERLLDYGVILKDTKCHFGLSEMKFLGHTITQTGICIQDSKVDAIRKLNIPKNKDQLRSVLGSFNYHFWQVPDLMVILQPLFGLLKTQNIKFSWTTDHTRAFNQAKDAIASAAECRFRNQNFQLVLSVDSSDIGVGAGLGQLNDDNQIEYLAYFSKGFTDVEKRYPIRQKELCGISHAVQNFAHILLFEPFLILNDHQSLQRLTSTPTDKLSNREHNLLYRLSHFNFKIVHISGKSPTNLTADMLSRMESFKGLDLTEPDPLDHGDDFRDFPCPVNSISEAECQEAAFDVDDDFFKKISQIMDTERLKKSQKNDPLIKKLKLKKQLRVKNGLYFKKFRSKLRLIIPSELSRELILVIHEKKGHISIRQTISVLSERFHITNLSALAREVVLGCSQCVKCKPKKALKAKLQKIVKTTEIPFKKSFCDLVDLGSSANEFRYGLSYFCSLTHFVDMIPIRNKKAETVTKALKTLFYRHGCPEQLVSDNGKEFSGMTSEVVQKEFGIYFTHISPFNAQSNRVERFHREFKKLCRLFNVQIENWEDDIAKVLFFYNISPQKGLNGMSPWLLCKAYEPRHLIFESAPAKKGVPRTLVQTPIKEVWEAMRIHSSPEAVFGNESEKVKIRKNDIVTPWKPPKPGCSKKLTPEFRGEYKVIRRARSVPVFELECLKTGQRIKRHIKLLRLLKRNPNGKNFESNELNMNPDRRSLDSQSKISEEENELNLNDELPRGESSSKSANANSKFEAETDSRAPNNHSHDQGQKQVKTKRGRIINVPVRFR